MSERALSILKMTGNPVFNVEKVRELDKPEVNEIRYQEALIMFYHVIVIPKTKEVGTFHCKKVFFASVIWF